MTGTAEDNREQQPDGANPRVVNGDFSRTMDTADSAKADFVPGWYYGRQVRLISGGATSESSEAICQIQ